MVGLLGLSLRNLEFRNWRLPGQATQDRMYGVALPAAPDPDVSGNTLGEHAVLAGCPDEIRRRHGLDNPAQRRYPARGGGNEKKAESIKLDVPGFFVSLVPFGLKVRLICLNLL